MKILQVIPSISLRKGGPAKAVLEISRALVERGHQVTIVSVEEPDAFLEKDTYERYGIQFRLFKKDFPEGYYFSRELTETLKTILPEFQVVSIHGLWYYPTFIASYLCRRFAVPYIIRPCGMLDAYCLKHHAFRKWVYLIMFEKENLRSAQAIHFTSQEERLRAPKWIRAEQAVIVPLGVDLKEYAALPPLGEFKKSYPSLQNKRIILFLGRISFKKGLDLLISAFAKVVRRFPNVHLVIAGPDDEGYAKKLQLLLKEQGIERDVSFIGYVGPDTKLALLRDSEIFCLPSYQENFGIAVIEAMATGLPIVISDQVNIWREIQNAKAGCAVSCNAEQLEEALSMLVLDEEKRKVLSERARMLVERRYSWDTVLNQWIALYQRVGATQEDKTEGSSARLNKGEVVF